MFEKLKNFKKNQVLHMISDRVNLFELNRTFIIRRSILISSAICFLCSCDSRSLGKVRLEKMTLNGKECLIIYNISDGTVKVISDPDCKCKDKE